MSDKKLKPRVGDRVLATFTEWGTRTADVLEIRDDGLAKVNVHGLTTPGTVGVEFLTILDRDPVEWPEGWSYYGKGDVFHRSNIVVDKGDLAELLRTGPDMLARWDELMGDEA